MLFLNTVLYLLFFVRQTDSFIAMKPRIVHGQKCTVDKHPYYVTFLKPDRTVCGGTLVTLQWIITAAHCFPRRIPDHSLFQVRAGFDEDLASPNIQIRSISNITFHPKYKEEQYLSPTPEVRNDIALVGLTEPFNSSKVVDTVRLPTKGFVKRCSQVEALGVGYNETVIVARIYDNADKRPLQCVTLKLVNSDVCQKSWYGGTVIDDSVICTQQPGNKDPCYGDSGGPLMCGHSTIVGIVSAGYGCGMPNATIFVNVENFLPFIYKTMDPNYKIPKIPRMRNNNLDKKKSSNTDGIFITSPINPILIVYTVYYNYICNILE